MDFSYTETQDMVRDTLSRFLADTYDFETRQKMLASDGGRDPAIWQALATRARHAGRCVLAKSMAALAAAHSKT